MDMRARYYDHYLNQFIQPDTIVPDYQNPQSLNFYVYVFDNPINSTDPSGYKPVDCLPGGWGCPPKTENYNEAIPPTGIHWISNPYLDLIDANLAPLFGPNHKLEIRTDAAQFKINEHPIGCQLDSNNNCIPNTTFNQNFCGQVVLSAILKLYDPQITTQWVVEHIPVSPGGTGPEDYEGFVEKYYHDQLVTNLINPNNLQELPNDIKTWINQNNLPMTFLNIVNGGSGTKTGGRVGANPGHNIPHWVLITGISEEWEQSDFSPWNWIRIFNPFDNQPEYYWWNDFQPAWKQNGVINSPYETLLLHQTPRKF